MIKFSGYKLIKKIGSGGMGDIYLAEHEKLEKKVAIKSLHKNLVSDKSFRDRFSQEAKTHSKLDHPNIVKLLDFKERKDGLFLIMEFVDGQQLDQYIKQVSGPIPKEELIHLFSQILDAISYAHKAGLVHRDIKPSNIMIDKKGGVKVLDFGIAKFQDDDKELTKTGVQIGTASYMSPEQVNAKKLDKLTDIYSLGVTLYYMAVGKSPYSEDTNTFSIQTKIVGEDLPVPSEIYPGAKFFEPVISKATQKDKNDRFINCDEFKIALNSIDNKSSKIEGSKVKNGGKTGRLILFFILLLFCVPVAFWLMSVLNDSEDFVEEKVFINKKNSVIDNTNYQIPIPTKEDIYFETFSKLDRNQSFNTLVGKYIDVSSSYFTSSILFSRINEIPIESHKRYGKIMEGLAYADRSVVLDGDSWDYESRAEFKYLLGKYEEALDDINVCIAMTDLSESAYSIRENYLLKVKILFSLKEFSKAITSIQKINNILSKKTAKEWYYGELYLWQGLCLNAMGEFEEACSFFEKSLNVSTPKKNGSIFKKTQYYLDNYCSDFDPDNHKKELINSSKNIKNVNSVDKKTKELDEYIHQERYVKDDKLHHKKKYVDIRPDNTYCNENSWTFELNHNDKLIHSFCLYRKNNNGRPYSGLISEYYSNGSKKYSMTYKKGLYNGKWIDYYNEDGSWLGKIKYNKLTKTTKTDFRIWKK